MENLNEQNIPIKRTTSAEGNSFDRDRTRQTAELYISELETLPEFEEFTDMAKMYRQLTGDKLIVRREDPGNLFRLIIDKEPLEIGFVGGTPYANAVEWSPEFDGTHGLDNAFLEGYSHLDQIVTVYGFEPTEGFHVEKLNDSQANFAGIDRTRVRSISGFVPPEAVRFVTLRIPIQAFPEERMTGEEKDRLWEYEESPGPRRAVFIYRGFLAKKEPRARGDARLSELESLH